MKKICLFLALTVISKIVFAVDSKQIFDGTFLKPIQLKDMGLLRDDRLFQFYDVIKGDTFHQLLV